MKLGSMRSQVLIHWGISSFYGWGVYGLNLALNWSLDSDLEPVCSLPLRLSEISLDPLKKNILNNFFSESASFEARLKDHLKLNSEARIDVPLLVGLGNDFNRSTTACGRSIYGTPTIGITFFEDPNISADAIDRAREFPLIVTGSTWNEQVLRGYGLEAVVTVLQGIDPTLFHVAPRSGLFNDRFMMFSGGKLEFRKGQDLVLEAASEFTRRHRDAVLVTAWHSPWPQAALSMSCKSRFGPVPVNKNGRLDTVSWARNAGVPEGQYLDLGSVPNSQLPPILREMDVGIFTNRGEGGTNLVAMECMACGMPVILSANTGHLDLIQEGVCYPLIQQGPVHRMNNPEQVLAGWGESSVPEIIEHLERIYSERKTAKAIGLRGAEMAGQMSWKNTAGALKTLVMNQISRVN